MPGPPFLLPVLGSLCWLCAIAEAQHVNLNFTGQNAWKNPATIPASGSHTYPDGIPRMAAELRFQNNTESVWQLDDNATVIFTQTGGASANRFSIGVQDGTHGRLTLASATPDSPGTLCARFSTVAAIRIGHAASNSRGTLRIEDGVRLQCGFIHGEGPSPAIELEDGRLDVFSGEPSKRLDNIAITLGENGRLWIEDPSGQITDEESFSTFTGGALIPAAGGELVFENQTTATPVNGGGAVTGTLIHSNEVIVIDPAQDSDGDGLPDVWETTYGLDPHDSTGDHGAGGDPDDDGLPNSEEHFLGSHPLVNESGKAWLPRPAKIGVLIVATHPDDEGIFFGGALPYYCKVKNIPTLLMSMTSGDWNRAPIVRETELRNAAWTYGLRHQPVFARFRDYPTSTLEDTWDVWGDARLDGQSIEEGKEKSARAVAAVLRRYKPEIVATHDLNGEYGHKNHMACARAVIDAWALAADPAVVLDGLPPWQAKKLYIHMWPENRLFHDFWETPYPELDGLTPRQVTNIGMEFHASQGKPKVSTAWLTGETASAWDPYPSEWWGLHSAAEKVPADPPVADFTINGVTYSGWARGDFLGNVNLDMDENGLPDEWEKLHFPLAPAVDPNADPDGDGVSNFHEYLTGTPPTSADTAPLTLDLENGTASFQSRLAAGPGYAALTRRHRLQVSTTLEAGSWTTFWEGDADGSVREISIPMQGTRQFYRLVTFLE